MDVYVQLGETKVLIDKRSADIGTVVKVKGTIDIFRNTRQLKIERIWIVNDTNDEVKAWAETAAWKQDVLAKPWVLAKQERTEIDEMKREEELREKNRTRKRRVYDAALAQKRRKHEEKREAKRRKLELKYDAGALKGSCVLPDRITDS